VIREVVKQGGGWWEGLLGSRRGVFPDNFVTVMASLKSVLTSFNEQRIVFKVV